MTVTGEHDIPALLYPRGTGGQKWVALCKSPAGEICSRSDPLLWCHVIFSLNLLSGLCLTGVSLLNGKKMSVYLWKGSRTVTIKGKT